MSRITAYFREKSRLYIFKEPAGLWQPVTSDENVLNPSPEFPNDRMEQGNLARLSPQIHILYRLAPSRPTSKCISLPWTFVFLAPFTTMNHLHHKNHQTITPRCHLLDRDNVRQPGIASWRPICGTHFPFRLHCTMYQHPKKEQGALTRCGLRYSIWETCFQPVRLIYVYSIQSSLGADSIQGWNDTSGGCLLSHRWLSFSSRGQKYDLGHSQHKSRCRFRSRCPYKRVGKWVSISAYDLWRWDDIISRDSFCCRIIPHG